MQRSLEHGRRRVAVVAVKDTKVEQVGAGGRRVMRGLKLILVCAAVTRALFIAGTDDRQQTRSSC